MTTGEVIALIKAFGGSGGGSSGGGVLVVHWNNDYTALDKTGQDILTAVQTGPVFLIDIGDLEDGGEVGIYMLQGVYKENGVYDFAFSDRNSAVNARCSSLSDYPEYYEP